MALPPFAAYDRNRVNTNPEQPEAPSVQPPSELQATGMLEAENQRLRENPLPTPDRPRISTPEQVDATLTAARTGGLPSRPVHRYVNPQGVESYSDIRPRPDQMAMGPLPEQTGGTVTSMPNAAMAAMPGGINTLDPNTGQLVDNSVVPFGQRMAAARAGDISQASPALQAQIAERRAPVFEQRQRQLDALQGQDQAIDDLIQATLTGDITPRRATALATLMGLGANRENRVARQAQTDFMNQISLMNAQSNRMRAERTGAPGASTRGQLIEQQNALDDASSTLATAQAMQQMLAEDPDLTGAWGPAKMNISRFLGDTPLIGGFTGDYATAAEGFQGLSNRLVLGLASGLKGVLSDRDIDLLKQTAPSLGATPEANRENLQRITDLSQRAIARHRRMMEWLQQGGQGDYVDQDDEAIRAGVTDLAGDTWYNDMVAERVAAGMSPEQAIDDLELSGIRPPEQ